MDTEISQKWKRAWACRSWCPGGWGACRTASPSPPPFLSLSPPPYLSPRLHFSLPPHLHFSLSCFSLHLPFCLSIFPSISASMTLSLLPLCLCFSLFLKKDQWNDRRAQVILRQHHQPKRNNFWHISPHTNFHALWITKPNFGNSVLMRYFLNLQKLMVYNQNYYGSDISYDWFRIGNKERYIWKTCTRNIMIPSCMFVW